MVSLGDKVLILPQNEIAVVKGSFKFEVESTTIDHCTKKCKNYNISIIFHI